jgi:hypothetical protein
MEAYLVTTKALAAVNEAVAVGALAEGVAKPVVEALQAKAADLRVDLVVALAERRPEELQALLEGTGPVSMAAAVVTAAHTKA